MRSHKPVNVMKCVIRLTCSAKEVHLDFKTEHLIVSKNVLATQQHIEVFAVNIDLYEIN